MGLRGIALSIPVPRDEPDFEALEPSVREVLTVLLKETALSLINVNFPHERELALMQARRPPGPGGARGAKNGLTVAQATHESPLTTHALGDN